ncbi:MAG: hypothetical protein WA765_03770 [Candidatus Acidiferrum sp.]
MPLETHILHGGMGRRWVFSGVLAGQDLIARNDHIFNSQSYEGVRWLIIDETAVTSLDLTGEQIRTIKRQDDRLALVLPEMVTAVIVPSDLGFGMTRMWEMLTERPGWSVRAFRSMAAAEIWLRAEVHRKFGIELPADLNAP